MLPSVDAPALKSVTRCGRRPGPSDLARLWSAHILESTVLTFSLLYRAIIAMMTSKTAAGLPAWLELQCVGDMKCMMYRGSARTPYLRQRLTTGSNFHACLPDNQRWYRLSR